jgi:TetR/AcrR family transcriptional repressor of nem operon
MHHIKKVRKSMRYDAEHKEKTRQRVLDEAAKAIRLEGPDRMGVAGVMARAGLTHGGFYAHFPSKEALVEATIGHMFAQGSLRRLREMGDKPPAEALGAYIDFYLSTAHRDARTSGCPIAALAADLPRMTPEAQARFAAGVGRITARIAEQLEALGQADAEALASSAVAELVGALSLARIEPDAGKSDLMLERSKRALKNRLGLEGRP